MTWPWGKAGQRLTPAEQEARRRKAVARRNIAARTRRLDDEEAHRRWRAGLVYPYRITTALDANDLYGPEVDVACGGAEPMVDEWEAGRRYPTWEQLCKLARLCDVTPRFFTVETEGIDPSKTSMRFHSRDAATAPPPVWKFTPDAIAEVVDGEVD